ncbi:MAG TPA: hypothetical protein VG838_00450 [Opitutaceae bacterium]|nr:hypothetical protein [Opitutaceae bacterium]
MGAPQEKWALVSGPEHNPVYFCMEMRGGRPVLTLRIERAHFFKSKRMAEAVLDEWGLDPKDWHPAEIAT